MFQVLPECRNMFAAVLWQPTISSGEDKIQTGHLDLGHSVPDGVTIRYTN